VNYLESYRRSIALGRSAMLESDAPAPQDVPAAAQSNPRGAPTRLILSFRRCSNDIGHHRVFLAGLICLLALASSTCAAEKDHANVDKDHLGIKGYDPVAYFEDGKPQSGDANITAEYQGVTYRFASEAHLKKFQQDPSRFVPAYGWLVRDRPSPQITASVDIDPKSFKVTGGRLYLFYKGLLGDARKAWVKDEPGNIVKANENWKKTVGE